MASTRCRVMLFLLFTIQHCCFSAFSAKIYAGSDPALRERFLTEAPRQWLEYRRVISRHTEIVRTEECISNLDDDRFSWKQSSILDLDRKRLSRLYNDGKTGGVRRSVGDVRNSDYEFSIGERNGGKWQLQKLVLSLPESAFPDDLIGRSRVDLLTAKATPFGHSMQDACLGEQIWRDWLPYLVSSSDFSLVGIRYLVSSGQFVEVDFGYEPKISGAAEPIVKGGGTLVLDTKRYWLLRGAEIHGHYYAAGRKILKIANEFKEFQDGGLIIPYVSHQVMTLALPEDNKHKGKGGEECNAKWTTDIEMRAFNDLDDRSFRLTNFGLPEPGTEPQSRTRPFLLILGSSILVILVIILALRRFRRRAVSQ